MNKKVSKTIIDHTKLRYTFLRTGLMRIKKLITNDGANAFLLFRKLNKTITTTMIFRTVADSKPIWKYIKLLFQ